MLIVSIDPREVLLCWTRASKTSCSLQYKVMNLEITYSMSNHYHHRNCVVSVHDYTILGFSIANCRCIYASATFNYKNVIATYRRIRGRKNETRWCKYCPKNIKPTIGRSVA